MAKILIKNGRVVDPAANIDGKRDVLIDNGKIIQVKAGIKATNAKIIDAAGLLVLPGLIAMHVHFRDPGRPDKETIASGSRAAALGGFTTVCCMANTNPVVDNPAVVKYIVEKARSEAVVNVLPIGAVTRGLQGELLTEMAMMIEEGAVAFSDDGKPIMDASVMRKALEYASQFDVPIISHCEDLNLSHGGAMNEGALSTAIGLPGIPAVSEENMIERDVKLAEKFGQAHIAHVSSAGSVESIRKAKKKKVKVTCETCPHYFSLTEAAVKDYDTNAKVNPPLKTKKDVQAIIKGLRDNTIDVIATDHAPHNIEEKNIEFNQAASGMVGLETALALALTKLVNENKLNLKQVIAQMTINPARILGINKGTLKAGADADIIIVDPKQKWLVDPSKFASQSKNTPFAGWELQGKVLYTIVSGKIVVHNGQIS